jgi:hypothetical protein
MSLDDDGNPVSLGGTGGQADGNGINLGGGGGGGAGLGGAIFSWNTNINMAGCSFAGNTATSGAGGPGNDPTGDTNTNGSGGEGSGAASYVAYGTVTTCGTINYGPNQSASDAAGYVNNSNTVVEPFNLSLNISAVCSTAPATATLTFTIMPGAGVPNVQWSISGGSITTASSSPTFAGTDTQGNSIYQATATFTASGVLGSLTAEAINFAGCEVSTSQNFSEIVPGPISIQSAPGAVCMNSTGNQVSAVSGYSNYSWTISGGAITAGQNRQTVTFTAGASGSVVLGITADGGPGSCPTSNILSIPISQPENATAAPYLSSNTYAPPPSLINFFFTANDQATITESGAMPQGVGAGPQEGGGANPTFYAIGGVPTQAGTFPFSITTTNGGCSSTVDYVLTTQCEISITAPSPFPSATTGAPYSAAFGPTGTIFSETGALPNGLTLSSSGVLSGTPTQAGSFPITVNASNANQCMGSASVTISVFCPSIQSGPATLPSGTDQQAYMATNLFAASGGSGPYSYQLTGSLPPGMSVTGGMLSGTPTTFGTFSFSVTATDSNGCTGTTSYSLQITNPVACDLSISPSLLPEGLINTAYSVTFETSGANGSATLSETGALPAGINFIGGVLSGTPTVSGIFPITITATDFFGCTATQSYLLAIDCAGGQAEPITAVYQGQDVATLPPGVVTFPPPAYLLSFRSGGSFSSGGNPAFSVVGLPNSDCGNNDGTMICNFSHPGLFPVSVGFQDPVTSCIAVQDYLLIVQCNATTISVGPGSFPTAAAGVVFPPTPLSATGGLGPYTFEAAGLPPGMSVSNGVLSGTPTKAGTYQVTIGALDSNGCAGGMGYTMTVAACPTIDVSPSTLPSGTAGVAYSPTPFTEMGGVGTTTFSETGALPTGMTLTSAGVLSGTPIKTGSFPITVTATDSNGCTGSLNVTLTINCPTINVTPTTVPAGAAGVAYTATQFGQTGGVGTVSYSLTNGTLPTGMTLSSSGLLSGTPTALASNVSLTVQAKDSNNCTGSVTVTLTVACPTISVTPATIPSGTAGVAYTSTQFGQTGGVGTITYSLNGTLPTGMTLSSSGLLSGTPTTLARNVSLTLQAKDANNCTGSVTVSLTVACPTINVTPTAVPSGAAGVAYTATQFGQTGGVGTITYSLTNGALPTGMTLSSSGLLSGTPTSLASNVALTIQAKDANNCAGSVTVMLTVACPAISVTPATIPSGTAGVAYTSTQFHQAGGVGTVTFSLTSGTLPTGMTLSSSGLLSGTPTTLANNVALTIQAKDSNNCTGSLTATLTVACPAISVTPTTIPAGTAGVAYMSTQFHQTGGVGAVTFSLISGTLSTGMTLSSSGMLSGTPTTLAKNVSLTIQAKDANNCTGSATVALTVACPTISVSPGTIPSGTAGVTYANTQFAQTGGVGTVTYSLVSGALPAGMALSSSGLLSGTPTTLASNVSLMIQAKDANNCTGSVTVSLSVVCPAINVSPGVIPGGTAGIAYTATQFAQAGGVGSITYSLISGVLPSGMAFSSGGLLSGTPTTLANNVSLTIQAKDANNCTGSGTVSLTVACPTITVSPGAIPSGTAGVAYTSTQFSQIGGVGATTFTESGMLPSGLTFANGVLSGTPVKTGMFPIKVTATDSNRCTGSQSYTLVINCPVITVSPGTLAVGTAGVAFSTTQFTETGGVGSITFGETGTLPTGMNLTSAGVLSGTPLETGTFPITVTATDSNGCTGSTGLSLVVDCPVISVSPATVPAGVEYEPYEAQFAQTGGVGAITFTTSSPLPTGFTLSAVGLLSGTPTASGTFSVQVTATDSNGCPGMTTVSLNLTQLDKCMHDDKPSGDFVQFSSVTGDYLFTHCGENPFTVTGKGTTTTPSGVLTITDKETGWTIKIAYNPGSLTGTVVLAMNMGKGLTQSYVISDTNPHPVCACSGGG